MNIQRTLNWAAALIAAGILSTAYLLDGPSEIDAMRDVAADLNELTATTAQVQP